jgi:MFS family permease
MTYQQLYACRVLTGIGIGGAIPIVFSVLGDLYPANQRSIVAAVVTTGSGLGMGIGQVIAGMLDDYQSQDYYARSQFYASMVRLEKQMRQL